MSIVQMSLYGTVLTIVVMVIRALAINRLPKRTFIILWSVVLVRLLIPFEITSEYSAYSFVRYDIGNDLAKAIETSPQLPEAPDNSEQMQSAKVSGDHILTPSSADPDSSIHMRMTNIVNNTENETIGGINRGMWMIIWGIGAVLCTAFFVITYVRCRMEFGMSLPVQNEFVAQWMKKRRFTVRARMSDRISTPLTYKVIHPVILLPKKMEWEAAERLEYVLWHEYMHIRYGDNALKMFAVAALCIHWFNPFVWAMFFLLNRDIELACDESVVRRCGVGNKSTYANMLISMEAKRSGLVPLCNNFSQNAIEERVRAIMKVKKISLAAVIFAAGLVVGVTAAFATSAANQAEMMGIFNEEFTPEEYDKLVALQFDGYENMTVAEYQDKVWKLTDTEEYRELLDRFSKLSAQFPMQETFYDNPYIADTAYYLFHVLEPLTAERWWKRDFGGYVSTGLSNPPENVMQDMAVLEYEATLTILNADRLTVGEYIDTRFGMAEAIEDTVFSADYSARELADEEYMQIVINDTMTALTAEFSTDELQADVEWVYQPLTAEEYMSEVYAEEEIQEEFREQWEALLKPYTPFGLTYEYDAKAHECKMYFQGKEVRGIVDEYQDTWITAHAGIGYAEDAIELYTVYEADQLTGLREATAKEQEEWTLKRRQTTDGYRDTSEEVREFLPGTKEDYQSILSLKKPGYEQIALADFNSALLEWGNEHSDSYDRIACDTGWNDFRVSLSDEDKEFIVRTVSLSGNENAMAVRSYYTGRTEEDVSLGGDLTKMPEGDEAAYVWCHMYYGFSYHISDKEKVTVGERDRCIGGMLKGIQDFWEQTDIEDILKMDKADIIKKLEELAKKYSTKNVTITVRAEEQIGFECMDERELMWEMLGEES